MAVERFHIAEDTIFLVITLLLQKIYYRKVLHLYRLGPASTPSPLRLKMLRDSTEGSVEGLTYSLR